VKIRSAVPENGCLIFFADKKTGKNICKTYTHPPHRRLRKLGVSSFHMYIWYRYTPRYRQYRPTLSIPSIPAAFVGHGDLIRSTKIERYKKMKSFAWFVFSFIHNILHLVVCVTWPVFRWLYDGARRGLPPVHSDLLMKSGIELAAMIRKRQVRHAVTRHGHAIPTNVPFIILSLSVIYIEGHILFVVATFTPRRSYISGARFTRSPLLASRCRSALWYTYSSHT